jgi:hypothetical protein
MARFDSDELTCLTRLKIITKSKKSDLELGF